MKHCPTCQRNYADDNLRFCLHDGGELLWAQMPADTDPEATLVAPKFPDAPTQVVPLPPSTNLPAPPVTPSYTPAPPATSGGGMGWKIAVAVLGVLLLGVLGAAGVILFWWQSPSSSSVAQTGDNPQITVATPTPKRATPTPTPEPTPEDTLSPRERAEAEADINDTLDNWLQALQDHDLEGFMSHYADRLEIYYKYRNWTLAQVREDKEKAFVKYYEMDGGASDVDIEIEPSGRRATATFLKTYYFKGDEKDFSGSVRSQMIFVKTGGSWLIAGERDLDTR
jgi:ketosteroid isomerase-like protein